MRMVVLPFHGIIPNSVSRFCWRQKKGRGWSLTGRPAWEERNSGLWLQAAAAASGRPGPALPPGWLTQLGHKPGLWQSRAQQQGRATPFQSTQQSHQDHNYCWYCFTINKGAENGFIQSVVCYLLKTLLLSPVTVATATSPRTEGPQSLRGHAKRSAHLQL